MAGLTGKLRQRNWLERWSDAVIAHVRSRNLSLIGNDLGHSQAAEPALAWAHAATAEGLGLIGAKTTEADMGANLASGNLLASANDYIVLRNAVFLMRAVHCV
ncbi:hypothetical protein A6723_005380 [Pseudomonas sp. AU11447]|nr:hypothetical protein A6723_005380 [Pseudomonas sp. AU11447]